MDKSTQLEYLTGKYKELKQQFLTELQEGHSLQTIKDMSYVLDCVRKEIQMLNQLPDEKTIGTTNSTGPGQQQQPDLIRDDAEDGTIFT